MQPPVGKLERVVLRVFRLPRRSRPTRRSSRATEARLSSDQFLQALERKLAAIERRHAMLDGMRFLRRCLSALTLPGDEESE